MRIFSELATTKARQWELLDEIAAGKNLTASDWVRMATAKPRLLPRLCELHGRVWVHAPTLADWENLLEVVGFKTEAELQAAHADAEGAPHAA